MASSVTAMNEYRHDLGISICMLRASIYSLGNALFVSRGRAMLESKRIQVRIPSRPSSSIYIRPHAFTHLLKNIEQVQSEERRASTSETRIYHRASSRLHVRQPYLFTCPPLLHTFPQIVQQYIYYCNYEIVIRKPGEFVSLDRARPLLVTMCTPRPAVFSAKGFLFWTWVRFCAVTDFLF